MAYDSAEDTKAHIRRVHDLLKHAGNNLTHRAHVHDQSKLRDPEKSTFDIVTPKLKSLTYGSDEYTAMLAEMQTALDHHYAHNSHHPQHFPDGVDGMSLFDVLEMLLDWKAASERHENGNIWTSIDHNETRFGLSPQLANILRNTARECGWED